MTMTIDQWRDALLDDEALPRTVKITGLAASLNGGTFLPTPAQLARSRQRTVPTIRKHMRMLRERGYTRDVGCPTP